MAGMVTTIFSPAVSFNVGTIAWVSSGSLKVIGYPFEIVNAESMDEDINKSIIENKVNTLEGEETKKTRRRGWWSKKS